jgi:NAD(P)-dependent dehydrogenase (short-subunit alcohol dehydrogenase family)
MAIAVVTGGAGDIGMAIGRALGRSGHTIAIVDVDSARCEAAVADLGKDGIDALSVTADISDVDAVDRMARAVLAQGEVAVIVNNAGRASAPDFETGDEADWLDAQAVNLNGAYFVTRSFLPALKARGGGVIVNIASGNGLGAYGNPAYSVAKAGLLHYTRLLAVEYGPAGIRAVSVVPGSVRTRAWAHRCEKNPRLLEELRKWHPLRRIVEPEDVANVVAFCVSDAARAITGSAIMVDCGSLAGNTVLADLITAGDRR